MIDFYLLILLTIMIDKESIIMEVWDLYDKQGKDNLLAVGEI